MKIDSIHSDEEKLAEKYEELIKPMLKANLAHMFYLVENPDINAIVQEARKLLKIPKTIRKPNTEKSYGYLMYTNPQRLPVILLTTSKEESRYIKAYGAEIISEDQFKEAITDLKGRRGILERQVGRMESQKKEVDDVIVPNDEFLKEFSEAAKYVLQETLKFPQKQAIIHKSVDTIIGEQCKLTIRGYIQMKEVFDNVKFHSSSRYRWSSKCGEIYPF